MGNEATSTPSKSDKTSPPPKEQPPIYPYPDWSAMQAYYGPGMIPPPYYSTPGHAPQPYMWAPQPIMPPFGPPYAMYPHGGTYPHHPAMPFVPQPMGTDSPAKSATEKENKSTAKKHKEVNCFAMSADVAEKASSEGSDGRKNETGVSVVQRRKQSLEDQPASDSKFNKKAGSSKDGEASGPSKITSEVAEVTVKPLATLPPYCSAPVVNSTAAAINSSAILPACNGVTDLWYKDEREMRREKRKQSNRESARRSRLRKQAETEELAMTVESLTAENSTLRSEIGRLTQDSEKLRSENCILQEKVKKAQAGQLAASSVVVENFLSMIDKNAGSSANIEAQDTNNNGANGKLRQLLDPARRTDAVAAS